MTLEKTLSAKFATIISMIILTDFAIIYNIQFLRQIIGFIFLTILPGALIIRIIRLNKISFLEQFVLSWGLSISFLMLFGLLINYISLWYGYKKPLTIIPLLISYNIAIIVLTIAVQKSEKDVKSPISRYSKNRLLTNISLSSFEKAFLIVPILFPALTVFGMYIMNSENNNVILIFTISLMSFYIIFSCIFSHKFSERLYPIVLFLTSIALLLLLSLRSSHLIGDDVHKEYYYFQLTASNLYWSIYYNTPLGACLSISLMPTIYNSFLNIDTEYLFKILYSLIYSISPLIIYIVSRKYVGNLYAFLASIFFMSQQNFLLTEYYPRTNVALLFYELIVMIYFSDNMNALQKRILFIIFMISVVVSHYATTYIFFVLLLVSFVGTEILSKRYFFRKVTRFKMIVIFFIFTFFWYAQVTISPFNNVIEFIGTTFVNLNKFFVEEMLGAPARSLLGEGFRRGLPYIIQFSLTWITFAFIAIGTSVSVIKYKEISFLGANDTKLYFLKSKLEVEYWVLAIVCSILAAMFVSIPFISQGYGIERAYTLIITFLSLYFVIGGVVLADRLKVIFEKLLNKFNMSFLSRKMFTKKSYSSPKIACTILLIVIIPYFLSVTGVTHELFGYHYQITLNTEEDKDLIHDQESFSAKWLKNHVENDAKIYADIKGTNRLISQGNFSESSIDTLSPKRQDEEKGYIYLTFYNVVNKKLTAYNESSHILADYNITENDETFMRKNNIYNDGPSKIYK